MSTRSARPSRGFTVIEMAVTVAVIGLLLALIAPEVGTMVRNTRIRSAAESVLNGLQQARNESVRRNEVVGFWLVSETSRGVIDSGCALSSTSGSWVVSSADPTGACAAAIDGSTAPRIVARHAAGELGTIVSVKGIQADGTDATDVSFNSFGRVANATPIANIAIEDAAAASEYRRLRILVSPGGQIRMCELQVTDATDPRRCPTGTL